MSPETKAQIREHVRLAICLCSDGDTGALKELFLAVALLDADAGESSMPPGSPLNPTNWQDPGPKVVDLRKKLFVTVGEKSWFVGEWLTVEKDGPPPRCSERMLAYFPFGRDGLKGNYQAIFPSQPLTKKLNLPPLWASSKSPMVFPSVKSKGINDFSDYFILPPRKDA